MTNEEALAMRAELEQHYGVPVMPVTQYCEAIWAWFRCIEERDGDKYYAPMLGGIRNDIQKSALLWRLIYRGEKLRVEQCPIHKGRWHGSIWCGPNVCEHNCDGTGWLPLPGDEHKHGSPVFLAYAVSEKSTPTPERHP